MTNGFKIQALVYHGTARENANNIIDARTIEATNPGYSGSGLYFWDGSKSLAEDWARKRSDSQPCVLSAHLSVTPQAVFDACCPENREILRNYIQDLEKRAKDEQGLGSIDRELFAKIQGHERGNYFNLTGYIIDLFIDSMSKLQSIEILATRAIHKMRPGPSNRDREFNAPTLYSELAAIYKSAPSYQSKTTITEGTFAFGVGVIWVIRDYTLLDHVSIEEV